MEFLGVTFHAVHELSIGGAKVGSATGDDDNAAVQPEIHRRQAGTAVTISLSL